MPVQLLHVLLTLNTSSKYRGVLVITKTKQLKRKYINVHIFCVYWCPYHVLEQKLWWDFHLRLGTLQRLNFRVALQRQVPYRQLAGKPQQ